MDYALSDSFEFETLAYVLIQTQFVLDAGATHCCHSASRSFFAGFPSNPGRSLPHGFLHVSTASPRIYRCPIRTTLETMTFASPLPTHPDLGRCRGVPGRIIRVTLVVSACLSPGVRLASQSAAGGCQGGEPLTVSIMFDQSFSVLPRSENTQAVYDSVINGFSPALQTTDSLRVYRFPNSSEDRPRPLAAWQVGERVETETIVGNVTGTPSQHTDLAAAVRRFAAVEGWNGATDAARPGCERVLVLVTDGSLSPYDPAPGNAGLGIKAIVEKFGTAVAEAAGRHVHVYAIGYSAQNRLAIDSVYWPKVRRHPVLYEGFDLATMKGDEMLRLLLGERYRAWSQQAVNDLTLFDSSSIYHVTRGYVVGSQLPQEGTSADSYFRMPKPEEETCRAVAEGARVPNFELVGNAHNELCTFHTPTYDADTDRLLRRSRILDVAYKITPRAALMMRDTLRDGSEVMAQYPIAADGSNTCSPRLLLGSILSGEHWPRPESAGTRMDVVWNGSSSSSPATLVPIPGNPNCFALRNPFVHEISGAIRPALWIGAMHLPAAEHTYVVLPSPLQGAQITATRAAASSEPKTWKVSGWVLLRDEAVTSVKLFVRDTVLSAASGGLLCPPSFPRSKCYEIHAELSSAQAVRAGVLVLNGDSLSECQSTATCTPVRFQGGGWFLAPKLLILVAALMGIFLEAGRFSGVKYRWPITLSNSSSLEEKREDQTAGETATPGHEHEGKSEGNLHIGPPLEPDALARSWVHLVTNTLAASILYVTTLESLYWYSLGPSGLEQSLPVLQTLLALPRVPGLFAIGWLAVHCLTSARSGPAPSPIP
ncbi:MAG: hypothetical protein JWM27_2433 [Gemmatimonadetes bacterium]|nr:hypothetical protein [Gemmatimonadota bacterium]